jgi:hypothetical protein
VHPEGRATLEKRVADLEHARDRVLNHSETLFVYSICVKLVGWEAFRDVGSMIFGFE